ncbi:hypothetical protein BDV59DRAFT_210089 [Aspergillus ambiguus]|uniref:uncharacterized protein n=1 Tax=Aspergillus ambiguus TaxID=176160 RepID=UPI003CCE4E84
MLVPGCGLGRGGVGSIDKLKQMLRTRGITKNLHTEEAHYVLDQVRQAAPPWSCLAFVNGVLLDNREVEDNFQNSSKHLRVTLQPTRRITYSFIYLPFTFSALTQLDQFRSFRRLLGRWAPGDRGLYARTSTMKADLCALSNMHNMVSGALRGFKEGRPEQGQALMRQTFTLHGSIVQNHHHRQFSDILGILLLIQRSGFTDIQASITHSLVCLAAQTMSHNDPRRIMFESLVDLGLDSTGHLYLAFDAYCRHVWNERTGANDAKACYSYNQASFPRADRGAFYEFFHGRDLDDIQRILNGAFMLWHTALRWLQGEQRHRDMEALARRLCLQRQLNLDSALSFYLLGNALEGQGKLDIAKTTFANCFELRSQILCPGKWDATKDQSLRRIKAIATRLGNVSIADDCLTTDQAVYSGVEVVFVGRRD